MKKRKLTIGVIFGGRSFEHEVSLVSARSIVKALDRKRYRIKLIGITKNGRWVKGQAATKMLAGKGVGERGQFIPTFLKPVDVFFPVLHGPFGEDGILQGFLEALNKPYVGAGVLSSAVGMDKVIQKIIWRKYNLPIGKFLWFLKKDWQNNRTKLLYRIEREIKYPCFVKPANSGSSIGVSKAHNRKELIKTINLAEKYDRKILIEKTIKNAREIEISVLGNDTPKASLPGEIIASNEFYDYDAKYVDGLSQIIIPARLNKKLVSKIQEIAIEAYRLIDCSGMARADFLLKNPVRKGSKPKIYLNEVNTIPGFTSISMYPKLWQASRLSYPKLLDKLIQLAIQRWQEREKLDYSYKPIRRWFVHN